MYNFCINSGKTGKSHFFMYDEATAHKGQNEVISFLNYYFSNIMEQSVETVYLFSDNCSGHNKNFVLTQFLYIVATKQMYGIKRMSAQLFYDEKHTLAFSNFLSSHIS